MTDLANHFHGSDIEKIANLYKLSKYNIVNYSSNVNPLGISPLLKTKLKSNLDIISTYPDRDYTKLKSSIACYTNTKEQFIVVGNGATELISLTMQTIKPHNSIIIAPTYSEYEREIKHYNGFINYFLLKEQNNFNLDFIELIQQLTSSIDLLVICNPNNPTSSGIKYQILYDIVKHCKKNNIFVVIDETYIEFTKDVLQYSSVSICNNFDNIIVIRGVSKFFASPGLRLGYAICSNPNLLNYINNSRNPWSINSIASYAGEIMFDDISYIQNTKTLIEQERNKIYKKLSSFNTIKVFEPIANFILLKLLKKDLTALSVFEHLIKENLMIRNCSNFIGLDNNYIRFCFLLPKQNDILLNELYKLIN